MAIERLKNAATISVDTSKINQKKLNITVTNTGAGHSIPTGVADLRQVWLEITIKDKNNKTGFQTGVLNSRYELPEDSLIFRTVFGDGNGNAIINLAKAKKVLYDNRIKAKQSVVETIDLPEIPEKGSMVTARLLYRSMSRKILNMVPGKPFEPQPVIEMARMQKQL